MYKPIHIDRENLTIMGVSFPDLSVLNSTASANALQPTSILPKYNFTAL